MAEHYPNQPVARFLDPDEQRRSLQHLMLAADRVEIGDPLIEPRARRRFGFLCGRCGARHVARVFDIAAEMPCHKCDALMIIPDPGRAAQPGPPQVSRTGAQRLYCPDCGSACKADRTRASAAFCEACERWF